MPIQFKMTMVQIISATVNGLPLHKLELKERALVMLLRNIDVNSGLCNGTTMKVITITPKIMNVQIIMDHTLETTH